MSVSEKHALPMAAPLVRAGGRSPLAQLLHALNQPLTGLQCSMEVALAAPRSPEQYAQGLRQGLELTERMRALVEAIREVVEKEEENAQEPETADLKTVLREVLDDLGPVAEVNRVRITLDCSADFSPAVKFRRERLSSLLLRTLESALSLAERGSALRILMSGGADGAADGAGLRINWLAGPRSVEFSRPELGLLVARAGWESGGAKWEREQTGNLDTVMVRLREVRSVEGDSR